MTVPRTVECPRPNACPISWRATHAIDWESVCLHNHHPPKRPEKDHFSSSSKWIRPSLGKYACAKTPFLPSNVARSLGSPGIPAWVLPPKLRKHMCCYIYVVRNLLYKSAGVFAKRFKTLNHIQRLGWKTAVHFTSLSIAGRVALSHLA